LEKPHCVTADEADEADTQKMSIKPMNMPGFLLPEQAVVVAIVSVFIAVLLSAPFYEEQAKKVTIEQMAGTLRSAMRMHTSVLFIKSRATDIFLLLKQSLRELARGKADRLQGRILRAQGFTVLTGEIELSGVMKGGTLEFDCLLS
jgi:hypothetical protein